MIRSNSKSLGNHVEEKERVHWEGFTEKKGLSLEWKRERAMENNNNNIISI